MENNIYKQLKKKLPDVKKNVSLANYTTFKVGGEADLFYTAKSKQDLLKAIEVAKGLEIPLFVLGGGSNLLVSDDGYSGLVIKCGMKNIKSEAEKNKAEEIYAGAGAEVSDLVEFCYQQGLAGLEWAAGIPGTVGGAVYGNIAAFGKFIKNDLEKVEVLDSSSLKVKEMLLGECKFGWKDSIFKHNKNLIILSAVFDLKKGNKDKIKERIDKCLNYRKKHHPIEHSSAGCIFKNYKGKIESKNLIQKFPALESFNKQGVVPAGFLIERSGMVGKKVGSAQVSDKHANFIFNTNGAKAKDIKKLINLIKQNVKKEFGVELEREIQYLD